MVLIDLEKAYDNVCGEKLWRVLFEYGVRGRLLRSIKALNEGGRATVKVEGMESQWFGVHKRVRQGNTLYLFNVDNEGSKDRVGRGSDTIHRHRRHCGV